MKIAGNQTDWVLVERKALMSLLSGAGMWQEMMSEADIEEGWTDKEGTWHLYEDGGGWTAEDQEWHQFLAKELAAIRRRISAGCSVLRVSEMSDLRAEPDTE
jgi:hypothetical protein